MAQAQLKAKQKELREFIGKTNSDEGAEVLRRDSSREKIFKDITADPVDSDGKPKRYASNYTPPEMKQDAPQAAQEGNEGNSSPEQDNAVQSSTEVKENVNNTSLDNSENDGIMKKKIRFYNINEESDDLYTEEEIEIEMQKSPIGQYISECVENDRYSIEMNYDADVPEYVSGAVSGKNIVVYVINNSGAAEIANTIIHEVAHKKFNWDVTQEDEVNCRIYEYLHSHKTISESKIKSIVDFVRENYSEDPEGEFYGY